jgi:hypothetical protein
MKYRPPPEPLPNVGTDLSLGSGSKALSVPPLSSRAHAVSADLLPAVVPFDEALPECQRHPQPQASRRHRKLRGAAGDFVGFHAVRRPVAVGAAVPSRAPPSSTFLPCLVLNVRLPHGARMTSRKHVVVIRRRRTIHGRLAPPASGCVRLGIRAPASTGYSSVECPLMPMGAGASICGEQDFANRGTGGLRGGRSFLTSCTDDESTAGDFVRFHTVRKLLGPRAAVPSRAPSGRAVASSGASP